MRRGLLHGAARAATVDCDGGTMSLEGRIMNIAHMLLRTARRLPAAPAVIERDRSHVVYFELADRVLKLAGALTEQLGQAPGARVALVMKNNAAYVELLYG